MSINDPTNEFILKYTSNPIANYLQSQQKALPGIHGEIFLTNSYGVLIGATGKLTTLAHSHKYWWKESFNSGKGKIFIDDRGFDESVQDYVLGFVVPVLHEKEVVGILKSNVRILGHLTNVITNFRSRQNIKLQIVRSGGRIIYETGVPPLTKELDNTVVEKLKNKKEGYTKYTDNNETKLVGFAPIPITLNINSKYGFGGKFKSIDHKLGNSGDSWYIIAEIDENDALATAQQTTFIIFIVGLIFAVMSALVAFLLAKFITNPIIKIASTAQIIGNGNLDIKSEIETQDEIGVLSRSINEMTSKLKQTMATRDELMVEIDLRREVEDKLRLLSVTDELTGIFNRRAFKETLINCMNKAKRYNEELALLLCDIDHFKRINDKFGHDVGDLMLKEFVTQTKKCIRDVDILARWGGEEFIILLPQTNEAAALQMAERLRSHIQHFDFPEIHSMTISIGFSRFLEKDTIESFVKRADEALYLAKDQGRNRVVSISM